MCEIRYGGGEVRRAVRGVVIVAPGEARGIRKG